MNEKHILTGIRDVERGFGFLAFLESTEVQLVSHRYYRRVCQLLLGHLREVFHYVSANRNHVFRIFLAVNNQVDFFFHRSVGREQICIELQLQIVLLVLFDGVLLIQTLCISCRYGKYVVHRVAASQCKRCFLLVRIAYRIVGYSPFLHVAEVHHIGYQCQCTHLNGELVHRLNALRYHLAFDVQFRCGGLGIRGYGNSLIEMSRTTVRIVGYRYLSFLAGGYRLFGPFRSGAAATGADVIQYQRGHTAVLECENRCYSSVGFVDLTKIVFSLVILNDRLLGKQHTGCQYAR